MSVAEIRSALEPKHEYERPFAVGGLKDPGGGATPIITHMELPYSQWVGPKLSWAEDFGKGTRQVNSRDGTEPLRSCNEVEVAKRLRRVRDHAVWVSSFAPAKIPALWRPWTIGPNEAPLWLRDFDARIRARTGLASGGIPDVVAWNEAEGLRTALFVECKGRKEKFKDTQETWMREALALGLRHEQVVVAVRPF